MYRESSALNKAGGGAQERVKKEQHDKTNEEAVVQE